MVDQEDIPDETAVGLSPGAGGAQTEIVPQVERPETVTAWSEADDDALTQPWPAVWKRATLVASVGVIAAVGIGVGGWMTFRSHHDSAPVPPAASVTTAVHPTPPTLDGTFRIEEYRSQPVFHGRTTPAPQNNATVTSWWAFRSTCMAGTCVAYGIKLENNDHTHFAAANINDDLVFKDGRWQDALPHTETQPCGDGKSETTFTVWTFEPTTAGTIHGTTTTTVTNDGCGVFGNSMTVPFAAFREGDAPAGVPVPSTVPTIAPPPAVPSLPVQTPDTRDQQLLNDLADHGVNASDFKDGPTGEWAAAKTVCAMRSNGTSVDQLVSDIQRDNKDMTLSADQAGTLIQIATSHLCPQYGS
jgi:serine/threonine-protein kinase